MTNSNRSIHIMTVTNDENGRRQIAELRKSIRESKRPFRVVFYGRGHRFGQGRLRINPNYEHNAFNKEQNYWLNTNK